VLRARRGCVSVGTIGIKVWPTRLLRGTSIITAVGEMEVRGFAYLLREGLLLAMNRGRGWWERKMRIKTFCWLC
jgi:hypothetical protein